MFILWTKRYLYWCQTFHSLLFLVWYLFYSLVQSLFLHGFDNTIIFWFQISCPLTVIYCFLGPNNIFLWVPYIPSWENNQCPSPEPRVVCLDAKHFILFIFGLMFALLFGSELISFMGFYNTIVFWCHVIFFIIFIKSLFFVPSYFHELQSTNFLIAR